MSQETPDVKLFTVKFKDPKDYADYKTGQFFMNLRVAITGRRATPPINESIVILGREETLERLKSTLAS